MPIDLTYTYWRERKIVGGGEKWSLIDTSIGEPVTLATIVRLDGTLARVYWRESVRSDGTCVQDYPSVPEARNAVETYLAALSTHKKEI